MSVSGQNRTYAHAIIDFTIGIVVSAGREAAKGSALLS
jgi:hypothetical protein